MIEEEILNKCKERFATHKATLIQDSDRFLIIDWRKKNGSGEYYVNYILDKKRGNFIISGDLGDCIATWYNPVKPNELRNYIKSIDYFMSKFQCSSNKFRYEYDDIFEDVKDRLEAYYDIDSLMRTYENHYGYVSDEEDFWDSLKNEINEHFYCFDEPPHYSDDLLGFLTDVDADCYEWLYDCGKRVDMRVYLWAVGYEMAYNQLEKQKDFEYDER